MDSAEQPALRGGRLLRGGSGALRRRIGGPRRGVAPAAPPAIATLDPSGNRIAYPRTKLVATFDRTIAPGSGDITILDLTDGTATRTIKVTDGSQGPSAGKVLTIAPAVPLAPDRNYAVQIAGGAVRSLGGVPFAGIPATDTTWRFRTRERGPNVIFNHGPHHRGAHQRQRMDQLPHQLRGRFLDQYVSGVVARDAVLGMEILLADDSELGAGVRESSATKVGFTRPEELADRMLACVAGTRNSDMLAPFVRGWLSNNSTKASTWANDALTGTTRDIALAEVVRSLVSKGDYDTAKSYRQAIVDESIRDDVHVP